MIACQYIVRVEAESEVTITKSTFLGYARMPCKAETTKKEEICIMSRLEGVDRNGDVLHTCWLSPTLQQCDLQHRHRHPLDVAL